MYFQPTSIIFFLCPLLQPLVGKLIKHILHIPLSPQIQLPSCSTSLANSETISSSQKCSGFLNKRNTSDTPTILSLPKFCISVLSLAPFFGTIRLLDRKDFTLILIERTFLQYLLSPSPHPNFIFMFNTALQQLPDFSVKVLTVMR